MTLDQHIREVGILHPDCALAVGGASKALGLTVYLEGPIRNDIAREGMWRGVIDGYPHSRLFSEDVLILTLDDGRSGKIRITSSEEGMALFQGIGRLEVPPTAEEEEEEILRILQENKNEHANMTADSRACSPESP